MSAFTDTLTKYSLTFRNDDMIFYVESGSKCPLPSNHRNRPEEFISHCGSHGIPGSDYCTEPIRAVSHNNRFAFSVAFAYRGAISFKPIEEYSVFHGRRFDKKSLLGIACKPYCIYFIVIFLVQIKSRSKSISRRFGKMIFWNCSMIYHSRIR